MNLKQNAILTILLCFLYSSVFAQKEEDSTLLATSRYFYYDRLDANIRKIYHLTYDQTHCHLPDALGQMNNSYYAHMANVGQSHLSLVYNPDTYLRFNYQPNLFKAYLFAPENIRFFQLEKPYTELQYFGGLSNEYFLNVTHSQNILKNWNVSIEDHLISSQGTYAYSKVLDNYFNANTHFFTKNGRYRVKGAFIYNRAKMQENGGIRIDSLFTLNLQTNRSAIPVNLTQANTGWREMNIFAQQNVYLHTPDSIVGKGSPFNLGSIGLHSQWNRKIRVYSDENPRSGFYEHIYLDSLSTFDSISNWQLENVLYWTNDVYNDHLYKNPFRLTVGIKQNYVTIHDALVKNDFMTLSPIARLHVQIGGFALRFQGEYAIGNGYSSNDLALSGSMQYEIKTKKFKHLLKAQLDISAKTPDFFYSQYNGNNFKWKHSDLEKEQLQRISGEYRLNDLLMLGGAINNLKNAVYLDETVSPYQNEESAQLIQLYTQEKLRWKFLRFENYACLQSSSNEDVFRIPLFELKESFYAEFPVFKKAAVMQAGIDLTYNTAYYGDAYMPALSAFYRQNSIQTGNHVWLDLFVSARIKRAFLFAKLTHFNALFDSTPTYYMIPHYPTQDLGFKWGFIWKFFD